MKKLVSGIIIGLALAACGSSGGSGGITFSPATESCSNPAAWTETIQLPASVKATDTVSDTLDGKQVASGTVSAFTQKADGSWTEITQLNVAQVKAACAVALIGSTPALAAFARGTHTEQWLDSSGKVLAQGSWTITMP